jgi:putative colanic acid biosynthesis glycosyltransferase
MSPHPKISIIMPTLNCSDTVERSICSVITQTYENIEFIIIDGESTDITLDIIYDYESKIDCIISEKDSGVYEAMNTGVKNANGKWLYFLGADDVLYNNSTIDKIFGHNTDYDEYYMLYGDVIYDNHIRFSSNLNFKTNIINTVHHQSAFYNNILFNEFLYNPSYKIVADYELNFIVYSKKYPVKKLNEVIAKFSSNGLSKAWSEDEVLNMKTIRSGYIGSIKNTLFYYLAVINYIRRKYLTNFC